ncbi:hypothetical protein GCM10023187_50150 [Nibrella viscosa]|uniref:SEC-C motif-containing protein n=1 Tax=Nibrella viscosa TaxID=1084524 RepID=A0ABP8KWF9_9BACT
MGKAQRERTVDDLKEQLKEQIHFLKASSHSFDSGYCREAKRLAVTLRILLHDTRNSKSVLDQLGYKGSIGFIDTCLDLEPDNLLTQCNLLAITSSNSFDGYVPLLGEGYLGVEHSKPFDAWWNKPVLKDSTGKEFTRKELVLYLAEQDGGAHVDPKLDEEFIKLSRENSMQWTIANGVDQIPINSPVLPAVRQIAYEVEKSLDIMQPPNNKSTASDWSNSTSESKEPLKSTYKLGRNEICFCGSGLKYKKCHGKP